MVSFVMHCLGGAFLFVSWQLYITGKPVKCCPLCVEDVQEALLDTDTAAVGVFGGMTHGVIRTVDKGW